MSKIIPYLWNENLILKKETCLWVERTMRVAEVTEEGRSGHLAARVRISKNGMTKISSFNKEGELIGVSSEYLENKFLKIFKEEDRIYAKNIYDKDENLISEIWLNTDGTQDEKNYTYENGLLVRIEEKDEDGIAIEEFKYDEDRLVQILSVNEKGATLMERKFIYDSMGKLEKVLMIQDEKIYKTILYFYNSENELVLKEKEFISRLSGVLLPPEICTYEYHENGVLKESKEINYMDKRKEEKKFELTTTYNELGLEIEGILIDFRKKEAEVTSYEYKMKEEI